jgi:hypothetical protein
MKSLSREAFAQRIKEAGIRPRLQRELRFVPEEITDWDDRDFLAVMNRSKTEGVLVFDEHIVPFQLQARKPNAAGRIEPVICDFCATWQRGSNSATITFTKGKSTQTFLCCGDLLCSLHVRDKTAASTRSRVQLRENNTAEQRVERLWAKLRRNTEPFGR